MLHLCDRFGVAAVSPELVGSTALLRLLDLERRVIEVRSTPRLREAG